MRSLALDPLKTNACRNTQLSLLVVGMYSRTPTRWCYVLRVPTYINESAHTRTHTHTASDHNFPSFMSETHVRGQFYNARCVPRRATLTTRTRRKNTNKMFIDCERVFDATQSGVSGGYWSGISCICAAALYYHMLRRVVLWVLGCLREESCWLHGSCVLVLGMVAPERTCSFEPSS